MADIEAEMLDSSILTSGSFEDDGEAGKSKVKSFPANTNGVSCDILSLLPLCCWSSYLGISTKTCVTSELYEELESNLRNDAVQLLMVANFSKV